jgi:hypothetical protein
MSMNHGSRGVIWNLDRGNGWTSRIKESVGVLILDALMSTMKMFGASPKAKVA